MKTIGGKLVFFACLLLILIPIPVLAKQGHMVLLAVRELDDGFKGSAADLYLEIESGSGRVFLDTYPLTKLDTQISARFAKEIACHTADIDCSGYDFIYTIKADSSIVAGPSAGAAATLLAISMLKGITLDEGIAMTGTINSGGLIGPVGGLKAKIDAAKDRGLKKVLIPKGERFVAPDLNLSEASNLTATELLRPNKTIDLVEYGRSISVDIVEVATIDDALFEASGQRLKRNDKNITISPEYKDTMLSLAKQLCDETNVLLSEYGRLKANITDINLSDVEDNINNLSLKANAAFDNNKFYSAASYCFGANVKTRFAIYTLLNLTPQKFVLVSKAIEGSIGEFAANYTYETISDLEASMIVRERLLEAEEYLDLAREAYSNNDSASAFYQLAYAKERLSSAESWSAFIDHRGRKYLLNKALVEKSCYSKVAEANERVQYLKLMIDEGLMQDIDKQLLRAESEMRDGDFELCLFDASKAKAESDLLVGLIGVEESQLSDLEEQKIITAEQMILRQQEKGVFPILAYSYYEYAIDLKDSDQYAALLYSGYAIELSNLDLYFEEKKSSALYHIPQEYVYVFLLGLGIGILLTILLRPISRRSDAKGNSAVPQSGKNDADAQFSPSFASSDVKRNVKRSVKRDLQGSKKSSSGYSKRK